MNEKMTHDSKHGSGDGVDVSMIRWMLSLTPRERLLVLQSNVRSIVKLRALRARG